MTLNLAHGRGLALTQSSLRSPAWFRAHLDEVAAMLTEFAPDVVALQEAELGSTWAGNFDHVTYLADRAGYPYQVATPHVLDQGRRRYGTALLSRVPLQAGSGRTFSTQGRWHKGLTRATVVVPHPDAPLELDAYSVHLDFASKRTRRAQIEELANVLAERTRPVIVMGDFNSVLSTRRQTAVMELAARAALCLADPWPRPASHPSTGRRIDWILHDDALTLLRHDVLEGSGLSDHRPVWADFQPAG